MITVLLADDEHLIRGALASLLTLEDDITVVAQAGTGDEALAMAVAHRPDVAVLDLQMPGLDGIAVATRLRESVPGCASMIVTSHARAGALKRALSVGVRGFVPKTVSAHELAQIIRTVHTGGRYVDQELAADAIAAGESPLTPARRNSSPTPRTAPPSRTSPPAPRSPAERCATTSPPPR